ncbi:putative hexose transporter [Aureobasidium pullulans]|uniref:Putative hexose transporter n=1 Tax=Aureobasidium pullulans TaxID=5580 RepID=A0A4S9ES87_AURPU|nr:putative hexose transporter [Aureobasidium pullulans]
MPQFAETRTLAIPVKPPQGRFFFAGHTIERVRWWTSGPMRKLYFLLVVMIMTNTADGFDGSMMNGLQSLSYWQEYFNHPSGSILGLFNASMSLGVGLQTGAANFGMFVASRLLIGFGDCIVLGSATLLITELAPPQDRAVLVTLSGASYHSGAFIASWVTYATLKIPSDWSWRLPSLLQCTFSIIISIAIFFTPESPRWLISKDRSEEALDIIAKYHSVNGDRDDKLVQLRYNEIVAAIKMDQEANHTGWLDLVKTPGNRKRMGIITAIGFFSQWSGNGIISYYLSTIMKDIGITSAKTQLGINGGMKSTSLVTNMGMSFFADKMGRRPMYLISTIGTFFVFNIATILAARYAATPHSSIGAAFVAMLFVYGFFYDFKNGLMATYTTEIMPYGLRAKGFTWLNFCALKWKYYICYCVFLAFEVIVIYLFLVETRYTPLEEIAKYFDGEERTLDVAAVANEQVKHDADGKIKEKGLTVQQVEIVDKV